MYRIMGIEVGGGVQCNSLVLICQKEWGKSWFVTFHPKQRKGGL